MEQNQRYITFGKKKNIGTVAATLCIITQGMRITGAFASDRPLSYVRLIGRAMKYDSVHTLPYGQINGDMVTIGNLKYRVDRNS